MVQNSLSAEFIGRQPISIKLLKIIRELGEFRGRQEFYRSQSSLVLQTLRRASVIESAESSNRLEGIETSRSRIAGLAQKRIRPKNNPEQEIAGYCDVLHSIHASHEHFPLTAKAVQQLHRDLYKYSTQGGGVWRNAESGIFARRIDGMDVAQFRPESTFDTFKAVERLNTNFEELLRSEDMEPLLLIPAYILDFLCIHPFSEGNGRTARLLTLLLLYKAGYEVGRFVSLEQVVENTRETYYRKMRESSEGWRENRHNLVPWWEYFLGEMLLGANRQFAVRTGSITSGKGAKREMIIDEVKRLPQEFRFADVERACLGISRPTFNRALADLRRAGKIKCIKGGRDAIWRKTA